MKLDGKAFQENSETRGGFFGPGSNARLSHLTKIRTCFSFSPLHTSLQTINPRCLSTGIHLLLTRLGQKKYLPFLFSLSAGLI